MGGTADPGRWCAAVAACIALTPALAFAGEPFELAAVPEQARTRTLAIGSHEGARVDSIEVELEGLPLRRPLARMLVDEATDEIIASVSFGDVPPWRGSIVLSEADAIRIVEDSGLPGSQGATEARLVADPRPSGTVAVWLVDPPLDLRTLTKPLFAVDAETGDLQRLYDQSTSVRLEAYRRNPALDEEPGIFTPVQFQAGSQWVRGPVFAAMNCEPNGAGQYCSATHLATPTNAAGDFLHAPPDVDDPAAATTPFDPFAEVSLYYHADKFMAWVRTFGVQTLDCTDNHHVATLVANYRYITNTGWLPFDNARYTSTCDHLLVFGQGSDVDYAYDGDVVAHELGHAVVDKVNGGVRLLEPRLRQDALVVDAGALNEAFADFLAEAFTGDPLLGEYIGTYSTGGGGAIRNADNDFTCPQSFGGEVHQDSESMAGALWDARQLWGNAFVRVVIGTIALLPDDASMEQASATLVKVTRWRLGAGNAAKMEDILEARGLLECRRIVDVEELRGNIEVQPPEFAVPYAPPPLQVRVEVPPGSASLRVFWDAEAETGSFEAAGSIRPGVLVKFGQPFVYAYDTSHGWPPSLVHGADTVFEDAFDAEIAIPVEPGTSVYLAFVNAGDAVMRVSDVEVAFDDEEVDTEGPDETDGETDVDTATDSITDTLGVDPPEEEGKKGCACRSGGSRDDALWLAWLLLLPALRRRR